MSEQGPKDNPNVSRVVLPSGRIIEVVNLSAGPEEKAQDEKGLHVCPDCDSPFVQPSDWSEKDDAVRQWHMELECRNCFWTHEGDYTEEQVWALEEALYEGCEDVMHTLEQVTKSNMTEEMGRFVFALNNDYVLPEDF